MYSIFTYIVFYICKSQHNFPAAVAVTGVTVHCLGVCFLYMSLNSLTLR